jgi:hypothetical protein
MDRYKVSQNHCLYELFLSCLKDAIFVLSKDDIEAAKLRLANGNVDRVLLAKLVSAGRIRRSIPSADIVAARVDAVVGLFRAIDSHFITDEVLKVHQSCLRHLQKGCLSDHENVDLYFQIAPPTATTFQKLKCCRGTSQQEGFHRFVREATKMKMVSPLLYDLLLADVVHRWNMDRAFQYGLLPDFCTYSINIIDQITDVYRGNSSLFEKIPCGVFEVPKAAADAPREAFGCRKIMNEDTINQFMEENLQLLDASDSNESLIVDVDLNTRSDEAADSEEAIQTDDRQESAVEFDEVLNNNLSSLAEAQEYENIVCPMEEPCLVNGLLNKVLISPYPTDVNTKEEVELYIQLFEELKSQKDGKVLICVKSLAVAWNRFVLKEIDSLTDYGAVIEYLKKIRFKSETQIRKFKDLVASRVRSTQLLSDSYASLFDLRRRLRQFSGNIQSIQPVAPYSYVANRNNQMALLNVPDNNHLENSQQGEETSTAVAPSIVVPSYNRMRHSVLQNENTVREDNIPVPDARIERRPRTHLSKRRERPQELTDELIQLIRAKTDICSRCLRARHVQIGDSKKYAPDHINGRCSVNPDGPLRKNLIKSMQRFVNSLDK